MHPFSIRGVGEIYLRTMSRFTLVQLFYLQGIANREAVPKQEVGAYYDLLKREDGGRAFLRIMRGFELTEEKQRFLWDGLAQRPYPAQVVWGERDPALGPKRREAVQRALGVEQPTLLPAKHFLQEDQAPAVAEAVEMLAAESSG
jgi:haloalkane dehalogenase